MSSGPLSFPLKGERLTIACQANEATKEIRWTKDDASVTARANIEQIGKNSTLVIEKVLTSDNGKYSCMAVNEAGSASSSVDIAVTGNNDSNIRFGIDSIYLNHLLKWSSLHNYEINLGWLLFTVP